ncbi:MAG TPA: heavy-metal-associated domain-containing protein [Sphaerochaeta sp.]|nr:heavy-metal-associated domain-containing protein [Sphaerochaeta sp.]HQB05648.1 heavy-metal-associated domain-containing protein [Sphaerochaeta sp.]
MKTTIMTKGMHCPGCENRVASILKNLEDIKKVKANAKNGTITIRYTKPETIEHAKAAIREAGYEVVS